ncbi:response regulator transcription factor [Prauserella cavernicola]|uniref:Sensory transduction protein RegX3 n=1 Tax=Prauserella cavernicola TaxID=2800127 RepID=A0A934QLS3_9PSEU|nr:response regulator transcription factor [Prauserella cavernicola]MBK1783472.1 response regulator transcription factor [Prauserella cavernicola]
MRVLIVEDDDAVVGALSAVLLHHGHDIRVARTAAEALVAVDPVDPVVGHLDVVLLDLGLPDRDGTLICRRIRASTDAALLIVSARDDVRSPVHGLDLGADDYLVKPYDSRELLARLNAVVRRRAVARAAPPPPRVPYSGRVRVDVGGREVTVDGFPVRLTRLEFDILELLARSPGVVVRYEQIISELWETSWRGVQRTLQVHIASLRCKLSPADSIETVRGIGYRLRDG